MNRFCKAFAFIPRIALFHVSYRQMSAVAVLLAVMMPVTVPIPIWAYDLNLPPAIKEESPFPDPSSLINAWMDNDVFASVLPWLDDKKTKKAVKPTSKPDEETSETKSDPKSVKVDTTIGEPAKAVDPENVEAVNSSSLAPASAQLAGSKMAPMAVVNQLPEDERTSIFSPENNLGAPPGQTEMDSANRPATLKIKHRPGSANFSFGVPLAFLAGRGIDAGVSMAYNSRTWNKSCAQYDTQGSCTQNHFTYDVEQSWIAPGFSSGFGYLESSAQLRNILYEDDPLENNWHTEITPIGITDPDGTRHQMQCKTTTTIPGTFNQQRCTVYTSSDGTRMDLIAKNYIANPGNQPTPNTSNYSAATWQTTFPGGTKVWYSNAFGSGERRRHYPFMIRDRNGNIVRIGYNADQSGRIDSITDTLNRQIKFYYELNGGNPDKLIAISIPGMNTSEEIQTVRLYYEDMALNSAGKFTGQITAPANIRVLRWVYMPSTKTAYKYDYHSNYGMIKKIERRIGVEVSDPASTTTTGTITNEGTWAATTEYNFPDGSSALSDAPKYDKRTDDWQGRPVGTPVGETFYNVNDETNTTAITVKDNGFDVITRTIADLGGMIKETSVEKLAGDISTLMAKNEYEWAGRNLTKLETTNEALLKKKTEFDYDQYNNQEEIREYDYNPASGEPALLRTTEIAFETGTGWINANLTGLVKSVKTVVNGVTVSKTLYEYDHNGSDSTLTRRGTMNGTGTVGTHDAYFNPDTPSACIIACPLTPEATCDNPAPDCDTPIYTYGYSSASAYRGNVTKIARMLDVNAATPDSNRDDVTNVEYDVLGNVVSATLSCCSLRTYSYDTTSFAFQTSKTSGSAPTQLTTSATYNMNTGLMLTSIDENGQETEYQYESDTLRPKKTIFPNDGYVESIYSDKEQTGANLLPGYVRQKTTLESSKFAESYSYFDARGLGIRSAAQTPDGWSVSAVEHDKLGRGVKSYNPFYGTTPYVYGTMLNSDIPAGTKFTEATGMDALGRTTSVKLQDNTTVSTYFSINTDIPSTFKKTFVTVTDQAGKQRRQVFDSLGRLIRVDEPDATGVLPDLVNPVVGQRTDYGYDGNDNLVSVIQSEVQSDQSVVTQERKFKYDPISRLTHEKQVEANPTLDDSGVPGAPDPNKWTKYLKYTPKGLLDYAKDARGVMTDFGYDGLNRVTSVTYTGESGFQTPTVTYTYSQARSGFYNNGALTRVETAATATNPVTSAEFDYDLMGRLRKHRQWIGAEQYDLEYEYNLAGQLTSQKYPSGKVVTNSYDANGRLSGIADAQRTYLSGMQYQGKGNALSQLSLGNGTTETYTLNDRFQMTRQELKKGPETLQKYDYGYGHIDPATGVLDVTKNNGQLSMIESHTGTVKQSTQKFKYDHVGRLKESAEYRGDNGNLTYKQVFDFDRFGNLYRKASQNPTTGQANPLAYTAIEESDISKSTNRFTSDTTYDDAGQVTTDSKFRQMSFAYDDNGRQVKATRASVPDAWTVYDAAGNRVATKVNNIWHYMVYDASGKLVAEYGNVSDGLGGVRYVQHDWQGSVRTVTNTNGFVVARTDHQAFGGEVGYGTGQRNIEQGYNVDKATRQGYGLTERDEATGQDHTWFRKNENAAGRWTSPDPYNGSMKLGDPQSFNRYSYVQNQPTNFIDPSGLQLRYYDVSQGFGCVLKDDGKFHCTEYINRYWYDDGGSTWDTPDPTTGGWDVPGGGGNPQTTPSIPQNCADELAKVGLLGKVQALFNTPIIDVNTIQNRPASQYFGTQGTAGLTAGQYFDQIQPNAGGAFTFIAGSSGITGIYRRGGGAGMPDQLRTHEVAHRAYPVGSNLDVSLAALLGVIYPAGKTRKETEQNASAALSAYFSSDCSMKNRSRR